MNRLPQQQVTRYRISSARSALRSLIFWLLIAATPTITLLPAELEAQSTVLTRASTAKVSGVTLNAAAASETQGKPKRDGAEPEPKDAPAPKRPPRTKGDADTKANRQNNSGDDKGFIPSEEISEDFAIAFPVDI